MGTHCQHHRRYRIALAGVFLGFAAAITAGQTPSGSVSNTTPSVPTASTTRPAASGVSPPADYLIGPDDVLTIFFWREKEMSGDAAVRPDGRISLPLINDIEAAGLTPEQLRVSITEAASKYIEQPTVTVVVKQINSRKVFITGHVAKPAPYPLLGPATVMQLIAMAGGLQEFADAENITILRSENGRSITYRFNYNQVIKRKNVAQNIALRPGDTVIVP